MSSFHYWIEKGNILPISYDKLQSIYNCKTGIDKNLLLTIDDKIYSQTLRKKINRNTFLTENKVVGSLLDTTTYKVIFLSDICRILYDEEITILEMNENNEELAISIFKELSENDDGVFIFEKLRSPLETSVGTSKKISEKISPRTFN